MKTFTAVLESLGEGRFTIGKIPPTPGLVDEYFNDSTGEGDEGETDARGPWNEGSDWKIVEQPAFEKGVENLEKENGKKLTKIDDKAKVKKSA